MRIFKAADSLARFLSHQAEHHNARIGFVPTMGALHAGHLSLMAAAQQDNDLTVCSIFVNPTQFNDPQDLLKYPRTIEADIQALIAQGVDVLFLPEVDEVYPSHWQTPHFDLHPLDTVLEGAYRPGHFDGVAQVVHRLLYIVQPHRLYLGQKDFQQWRIVDALIQQLSLPVELICCPISREADGLARSSRNVRLTPDQRHEAPFLYQVLHHIQSQTPHQPVDVLRQWGQQQLQSHPSFRLDYLDLVDGYTLQPVQDWAASPLIIACLAAYMAEVRLIDNLILIDRRPK